MGRPTRLSQTGMARKIKLTTHSDVRDKISASMLLVRLQNHALGRLKKPMDASQVSAAQILLRKILPDLSSVDNTHEAGPFDGLDDDDLNELLFEALRDLQEMYAIDAEAIIRRISGPTAEPAGAPAGSGTEESSTGLKGGERWCGFRTSQTRSSQNRSIVLQAWLGAM